MFYTCLLKDEKSNTKDHFFDRSFYTAARTFCTSFDDIRYSFYLGLTTCAMSFAVAYRITARIRTAGPTGQPLPVRLVAPDVLCARGSPALGRADAAPAHGILSPAYSVGDGHCEGFAFQMNVWRKNGSAGATTCVTGSCASARKQSFHAGMRLRLAPMFATGTGVSPLPSSAHATRFNSRTPVTNRLLRPPCLRLPPAARLCNTRGGFDAGKRPLLCGSEEQARVVRVPEGTWEEVVSRGQKSGELAPTIGVIRIYASQAPYYRVVNAWRSAEATRREGGSGAAGLRRLAGTLALQITA